MSGVVGFLLASLGINGFIILGICLGVEWVLGVKLMPFWLYPLLSVLCGYIFASGIEEVLQE